MSYPPRSRRRHAGPRYSRSDSNHVEIASRLRLHPGVSVWETQDVGGGFGDVVVGYAGRNWMFEIKRPGHEGELTAAENLFRERWHGHYAVVSSVEQILDGIGYPDYRPPGEEKAV